MAKVKIQTSGYDPKITATKFGGTFSIAAVGTILLHYILNSNEPLAHIVVRSLLFAGCIAFINYYKHKEK